MLDASNPYIFPVGVVAACALAWAVTCMAAGDRTTAVQAADVAPHAFAQATVALADKARVDADADFVAMMVPHHERAIEMAEAEVRFGRDEALRRLALDTIATSRGQIVALQLALAQSRAPAPPDPDVLSDARDARPRADPAQ